MVGAAKLGSDLEATNRAVGVSGSAHTKAALARGRDAVVEGDRSVVEADVEERRLLGVHDGGLAEHGLRRRRLVQEAVGRRQEQGSYEIGLRSGDAFRGCGGRRDVASTAEGADKFNEAVSQLSAARERHLSG